MKAHDGPREVVDIFLAGVGSGLLDLRRLFKAVLACCTALKSTGESVRTASLKGVTGLEGVC